MMSVAPKGMLVTSNCCALLYQGTFKVDTTTSHASLSKYKAAFSQISAMYSDGGRASSDISGSNRRNSGHNGMHPRVAAALAAGLHPRRAAELVTSNGSSAGAPASPPSHRSSGLVPSSASSRGLMSSSSPFAPPAAALSQSSSSSSNSPSQQSLQQSSSSGSSTRSGLESARSRLNRMLMNSSSSTIAAAAAAVSGASSATSSLSTSSSGNPFESLSSAAAAADLVGGSSSSANDASGRSLNRPTVHITEDDDSQDITVGLQEWHLYSPSESYLVVGGSGLPLSPTSLGFHESTSTPSATAAAGIIGCPRGDVLGDENQSLMLQLEALEQSLISLSGQDLDESRSSEVVDAMEALTAIHTGIHQLFNHQMTDASWDCTSSGGAAGVGLMRQDSTDDSPSYFNFSGTTTQELALEDEIARIEAQLHELHMESESLKLQLVSVPDGM
eukprot:TRINITY_DN861_c0_g1_i3.p1 TRINITY_DN861_c0_g1~~TRINITY_DN861_c0_g1_i3.p1  ORF type:complete len:446 (+),score=65.96 TRINITY_DN861_c0_g1_i3:1088-2425(+)